MSEQRRIGYRWNLRALMAKRNLWKTTELTPLLKSRGINLSESQVYRLVTATPERIPARTFAALCDILDCTPNVLFEPFVEMRAAATANAPKRSEDLGIQPGNPIAQRVRLITPEDGAYATQSRGPYPLAGPLQPLPPTPPNRRTLARRRNLRLLLSASKTNPRSLQMRPRRRPARNRR